MEIAQGADCMYKTAIYQNWSNNLKPHFSLPPPPKLPTPTYFKSDELQGCRMFVIKLPIRLAQFLSFHSHKCIYSKELGSLTPHVSFMEQFVVL